METTGNTLVAWSAVVGTLLPLVISMVKSNSWSTQIKRMVALLVSAVAAVITTGAELGWDMITWDSLLTSFPVIFAMAQTTYTGFWEDTAPEKAAEAMFDRAA